MDTMVMAKQLVKTFNPGKENEVQALRGIDVTIQKGEFVGVIGPSGSGKSTLMNLIGALDTPTQGKVEIAGQGIAGRKVSKLYKIRAQNIGFVFQGFNLLPTLTALENVMLAAEYSGHGKHAKQAALKVLKEVGLGERANHFPSELSGGEAQRVAIARALVNQPALVLADEPTGQLDSKTSVEVVDLMKRLCHDNKQTFVVVTHNPEVARACDRIIVLRDGEIVQPHHAHYPQHLHSLTTDNILILPHRNPAHHT
jgi:putative ABC transport system ATP-binding protein